MNPQPQVTLSAHMVFGAMTASATLLVRKPSWRARTILWLKTRSGLIAAFAGTLYHLAHWFEHHLGS